MKNIALAVTALIFLAFCVMLTAQIMVSVDLPASGSELKGDARFDFATLAPVGPAGLPAIQNYTARDNTLLGYRLYRSSKPAHIKLYLIHAAGWQAMEFSQIASRFASDLGMADVYLADMRGHGSSPAKRGDVEYAGQLEDDLAEFISQTSQPGDIIVVGGHGEGATVALRYATGEGAAKVRGCITLAPILSYSSTVNRPGLGGWIKPLGTRMAGLWVLNAMGLHWSDHEIVQQFAMPSTLRDGPLGFSATPNISWLMYKSLQMRQNDAGDLSSLKAPLLNIVGSDDEVVDPVQLTSTLKALVPTGQYRTNAGETHINLVVSAKTLAIIQDWLSELR